MFWFFFFFKQKTAYEMRISDWSSDVCSSDLIAYGGLVEQAGDEPPEPFSALTSAIAQPQLCCHITQTTPASHALIRENLHRAPLYSGQLESVGPRYCPSIEDKVVRFAERRQHQIFLAPERTDDPNDTPNGISTSRPKYVHPAPLKTNN